MEWRKRSLADPVQKGIGYYGSIEFDQESSVTGAAAMKSTKVGVIGKGKQKEDNSIDDVLANNADLIEELGVWQEIRVRKGNEHWISEREEQVGE